MHIETLEAVYRESKRLPPIQKVRYSLIFYPRLYFVLTRKDRFKRFGSITAQNTVSHDVTRRGITFRRVACLPRTRW